jgi:hypothetical protein
MSPRYLAVSRAELRQYRGSLVDEAVLLLIVLAGIMMLVTPQVSEGSLPSSHKIYRVGYLEGGVFGHLDSYTLDLMPYSARYEMIYASNINQIDGFAESARKGYVVFGSGTMKSDAALGHMGSLLTDYNSQLILDNVQRNANLSGILLPVRLQVFDEDIDYSAAINGSVDLRRRQLLGTQRLGEEGNQTVNPLESGGAGGQAPPAGHAASDLTAGPVNSTTLSLPSDLAVEFPFKNLYKNMTLLSPIILLSILLSLSLARERVDRNIENLFACPLSTWEILLGKSLPYFAAMAALSLGYGLWITSSMETFKAAAVFLTISATMVSFSLFSVVVSRSYRELTFIGSFSMFAFFFFIVLPNVFAGVNVLAFISPLDTVTSLENGASVPAADVALSLLPYAFLCLFFLSFVLACFTPEVMQASMGFSELMKLFYRTLSKRFRGGAAYAAVAVALLVPFIFIVESIMAYLVMPLGSLAPVLSLMLLAVAEETVKIIPLYYKRMNPIWYGLVAGAAFFATEKLFNLYLIAKVYSYLGGPYMFFLQNMAPTLLLHVLSTSAFALIVYYGRRRAWFPVGLLVSVMMHVVYNSIILGGLT